MRILAAIVTHNRCALLSRCLDHLRAQTRAPDEVLVVNNASTDGTEEMLRARGTPYVTQENLGSAGGWNRCIAHALEQGFDAVWLMDDDGFPDAAALAALEPHLTGEIACVSSVVVREDEPGRFVFPFPRFNRRGLPRLAGPNRRIPAVAGLASVAPAGTYPFAHFFNGALISCDAIRRVGNVDSDFFMFGDEVDYFFRLKRAGEVKSVLAALHYHPDVSRRPFTPAKIYYYIKNTLILNRRYFDLVWLRDLATVAAVLGRTASRNGAGLALSLIAGRKSAIFYPAILRGLQGRIGRDFDV